MEIKRKQGLPEQYIRDMSDLLQHLFSRLEITLKKKKSNFLIF